VFVVVLLLVAVALATSDFSAPRRAANIDLVNLCE
jgi:hypothetical protein